MKQTSKTSINTDIWELSDLLRNFFSVEDQAELIYTYLAAKMISVHEKDGLFNKNFISLKEINNYLISKDQYILTFQNYENQISEDAQIRIIELIKKHSVSDIIYNYYSTIFILKIRPYDLPEKICKNLAKLIDIKNDNCIADIDCKGSIFLKELIQKNKFKGEIHLFSNNKFNLKYSFVNLYTLNKKINLHYEIPGNINHFKYKFDFIYCNPPFGEKTKDLFSPISNSRKSEIIYSEAVLCMLKDNAKSLLVLPYNIFFNNDSKNFRFEVLNNKSIDFLIRIKSHALEPLTNIPVGILLLTNTHEEKKDVLIGDFDIIKGYSDLDIFLKKQEEFFEKGKIETIYSPLIFSINKKDLRQDFAIDRLNPIFRNTLRKVEQKFSDIKLLQDLCEVIPGTSGISGQDYKKFKDESLRPYIRIQDMQDTKVLAEKIVYVDPKNSREPVFTKNNDILFSVSGTIGKCALIDNKNENSIVSKGICILRPNSNLINPEFLIHILSSKFLSLQIDQLKTGAYISHLPLKNLRNLKIPIFSLEKQQKIIDKLKDLEKKLVSLKNELRLVNEERNRVFEELVD
jgi:16S rRNA G966 N2-methylase RsmD